MADQRNKAIEYAHTQHAEFLKDLGSLVSIPSVSTSPEHRPDIDRAAEQVSALFKEIGLEHSQILPTSGHPVVYADWLHAGSNQPTVLIYGHYDVQPTDPLDQWETGPFEPSLRGDYLFGRGASDMKGQVVAVLSALRSIYKIDGRYPVNLKCMIEGE
jgi:acetylornithine deacetylase/succinyl-diaminopimelate desuccinylase-like protein